VSSTSGTRSQTTAFHGKNFKANTLCVCLCVFAECVTHLLLPGCALLFPEALPTDANGTPAFLVPLPWKRRTALWCSAGACCLVCALGGRSETSGWRAHSAMKAPCRSLSPLCNTHTLNTHTHTTQTLNTRHTLDNAATFRPRTTCYFHEQTQSHRAFVWGVCQLC
jgi:hypothetical protein